MTSADLTLIAALGASALTGLVSLGVVWFQECRRAKARDRDALRAAIQELLSRSMGVATRARAMADLMRLRSGLKEGLDIAMRHRKPVDLLELHDWLDQDIAPMNAALSEIWTRDSQEGIRLANDVMNKCMDLLGASTTRQQTGNGWERVRVWAAGERWAPEMIAENNRAMQELARARKRYAEHARARFGLDVVELFTVAQAEDEPAAVEDAAPADDTKTAIQGSKE